MDLVRLRDFDDPQMNDWLAVNQFTVIQGQHNRRPDLVVFVNGLPLGVIELKNTVDEDATIWSAFNQLQTYQRQIGGLRHYNAVLVVSDGAQARIVSLTASQEWFRVWRTIDDEGDVPKTALELEVLVLVKRILNRYGYPPDLQEEAVRTVLAQAELVCAEWAA